MTDYGWSDIRTGELDHGELHLCWAFPDENPVKIDISRTTASDNNEFNATDHSASRV